MRFLLTTHQFFPEFHSGTEVLTLSVARELRRRGHDVAIYTGYPTDAVLADSARFDEYVFEGFKVYRFHHSYESMGGQTSRIEIGYDNALSAAHFRHLIRTLRPERIHFFHLNRLGSRLIPVAVEADVPATFTPTDFWMICATGQMVSPGGGPCEGPSLHSGNCVTHFAATRFKGSLGRAVGRIPPVIGEGLARMARNGVLLRYPFANEVSALSRRLMVNIARLNSLHKIFAPNAMMENLLVRYGVSPERIARSAYGIDMCMTAPNRTLRTSGAKLRIGFIGTLAPYKGCHVLLEALRKLPHISAQAKIYGRQSDFPDYVAHLRQLSAGAEAVELCGVFPIEEIAKVLADLDVLVVPSTWNENTPLVIYAAQAARCLVVGSNVPGISEAVRNGVDSLLFEAGNAAKLAQVLRELIDNPALLLRLQLGCTPPRTVSAYVDDLMAIWEQTVESRHEAATN